MDEIIVTAYAASLRNARSIEGGEALIEEIKTAETREQLLEFLATQGNIHLEKFYEAGRGKGLSYEEIFSSLKKQKGRKGLSNSEICAAAALWGAQSVGAKIQLVSLANHFDEKGKLLHEDVLRQTIQETDGFMISSPVYFGDRSSLSQKLIDYIRNDSVLKSSIRGKIYGGSAVGAKRNGGQETCLIYQMNDMIELGTLGVGNDYETTSQYGGTGHAGDVGTMAKDDYGLKTAIGTGKRLASVATMMHMATEYDLNDKPKLCLCVLQEQNDRLFHYFQSIVEEIRGKADIMIIRLDLEEILPCMACDICPTRVGLDQDFRCIRGKQDALHRYHNNLLDSDVIVPAMLSPNDRTGLVSVYQAFIERLRYIRRGDYALSNRLIAPLIISEIGSNENLNMRMITSFIRHHTVMHAPIIGWFQNNRLLNKDDLINGLNSVIDQSRRVTLGRLIGAVLRNEIILYKPIGYVLSTAKDSASDSLKKRAESIRKRIEKTGIEYKRRVHKKAG